jgi:hypothetical protein
MRRKIAAVQINRVIPAKNFRLTSSVFCGRGCLAITALFVYGIIHYKPRLIFATREAREVRTARVDRSTRKKEKPCPIIAASWLLL